MDENPELRSALDELRRTRAVLRSQPRLRAPRNFTLTAEMAGVRTGVRSSAQPVHGSYPVLRLASVLATIFFIVITIGELAVRIAAPAPLTVAISQDQPAAAPFGMGGGGGAEGPAAARRPSKRLPKSCQWNPQSPLKQWPPKLWLLKRQPWRPECLAPAPTVAARGARAGFSAPCPPKCRIKRRSQ